MMRKSIICIFLAILIPVIWCFASPASVLPSNTKPGIQDTLPAAPEIADPILSYQNLLFKKRLDSLQKNVSLSYNEHVQKYIDTYISRKEQIGRMLGLSEYYFPIFEKALKEVGIPEELKFLTVVESALNPQAVSRSGAVGPWQFMSETAKGYGLKMDTYTDERKDPVKASHAAAQYLMDAYKRTGDWLLTIAAYNCGTGAVTRAIQKSGGIADFWRVRPFLPVQTQNYVPAFIATIYAMSYHKDHQIFVKPAGFNILTDIIPVNKRISINSVAEAAGLDLKELLILNPSYKKQIINGSESAPASLVIPTVTNSAYASLYDLFNNTDEAAAPVPLLTVNPEYKSTSAPESAKFSKPLIHKVKAGESLSVIARKYELEPEDLKAWNNIKGSHISPGQSLALSPDSKKGSPVKESNIIYYTVKAGDTLSAIADKFKGATVEEIRVLNGLVKSAIRPGMRLKINKG
ncbi:lytic transglycosylase domain-containing protein [Daejeonella sp. H1SJ63]|uniref:lytic transglycosylase domain-containing protein n=1 Tax=Daejeonella sp. H1SJ63 TaxID=3034145 RepID=UPI0023ECD8A1|nr:lytic transglycosylase domain-containing protein [Daejeonella sp. H1SJ63]